MQSNQIEQISMNRGRRCDYVRERRGRSKRVVSKSSVETERGVYACTECAFRDRYRRKGRTATATAKAENGNGKDRWIIPMLMWLSCHRNLGFSGPS